MYPNAQHSMIPLSAKMYKVPRFRVALVREGSIEGYKVIDAPCKLIPVLDVEFFDRDREVLLGIYVDIKNRIIGIAEIAMGGANNCNVDCKQVFKPALLLNATGLFLAHNHPSGDPTPSRDDIAVTVRMYQAAQLLDFEFIDHLVWTPNGIISLRDSGLWWPGMTTITTKRAA